MNSIDFSLKLNQFPIDDAKKKLKQIQSIPSTEFADYVNVQKANIVNYHLENNSFYKSLVKKGAESWHDLPVLTKRDLQIPLTDRLSKGFTNKDCYLNKTSGSTGDPFYFAKDKFTHALTWAVIQNRFNWHDLYGKKQARFYGMPKDTKGYYKERLKDLFANRYRFNVFDLSDEALEKWIKKDQSNPQLYSALAHVAFHSGDVELAEKALNSALEHAQCQDDILLLAEIKAGQEQAEEALKLYKQGVNVG